MEKVEIITSLSKTFKKGMVVDFEWVNDNYFKLFLKDTIRTNQDFKKPLIDHIKFLDDNFKPKNLIIYNGKEVYLPYNIVQDIEQYIDAQKENGMEELFLIFLNGCEISVSKDSRIFYVKDGNVLMIYDFKEHEFRIRFDKIWSIFEKNYDMGYTEVQDFFIQMIKKYLNITDAEPKTLI